MKKTLKIKTNQDNVIEIIGDVIVIPVFEDFEFMVHRSVENPKLWTVTECSSGCAACRRIQKKKYAVQATQIKFVVLEMTPEKLRDVIKRSDKRVVL